MSSGNYTVILKESNVKIGAVGIFKREGLNVSNIGFSVLEEFEGKCLMYEAASKIKDEVMNGFGLKKSQRLLQKTIFFLRN